jgi:glycosyltransferase involved in cell wall biosynthesis
MAFVFVGMPVGGAEDFAIGAARRFGPAIDARFVCLRNLDILGTEARESGLRVDLFPAFPRKLLNPFRFFSFARWLRAEGIDIVHSQTYHAHIFCAAAAHIAGIRFVLHQQKTLSALPPKKQWIFARCVRAADALIALSEQTRADLAEQFQVDPARIHVVPNAIDDTVFRPAADRMEIRARLGLPPSRFIFGTVASLHPVKNHRLTLQALAKWPEDKPRPFAVFVGEGPARAELERESVALGLQQDVLFAGRQRPVVPWFQAVDAFLLPSFWEGQPLAMLQALSCGLPVLASRIEGNTAVLGTGHPALFSPESSQELLTLLVRVSNEPGFFQTLRAANSGAVVLSSSQAARLLEALYRRLVSQPASP